MTECCDTALVGPSGQESVEVRVVEVDGGRKRQEPSSSRLHAAAVLLAGEDADVVAARSVTLSNPEDRENVAMDGRRGQQELHLASSARSTGWLPRMRSVTIEPARPPEIVPLMITAYCLTPRETKIVQAMTRGEATQAIAQSLHLSPYTVQDHFQAIFAKLGVSSRREVASRLFTLLYADAQLD